MEISKSKIKNPLKCPWQKLEYFGIQGTWKGSAGTGTRKVVQNRHEYVLERDSTSWEQA